MVSVQDVLDRLKSQARPDQLKGMARYGMAVDRRLGVSVRDMRLLVRDIGTNHNLALNLWQTGIAEAQIVASMIADPAALTEEQMEDWVQDVDSWDVCDQVCMNLYDKSPLAWKKIYDWSEREEEFVRRTAFALAARLASHDRKADDSRFIELLSVVARGASDDRNMVKKAVNWALRSIRKRNRLLHEAAMSTAREIQRQDSRSARWIASRAIRELESEAVQSRIRK